MQSFPFNTYLDSLVTELLIDGISSQKNVLNDDDDDVVVVVVLLILLKSMSRLSWNRRVTVCYEDSGRYGESLCRLMPIGTLLLQC